MFGFLAGGEESFNTKDAKHHERAFWQRPFSSAIIPLFLLFPSILCRGFLLADVPSKVRVFYVSRGFLLP
jgi:hypothetical protein